MIKFSCMLCGEKLSAPDQFAGKRIKCPKCNNTSIVPAESPRIRFECKNCGKGIRVLQIHAGKEGKCPRCKSPVVVPSVKVGPGEDPGTVTVVCSMCNERIRAPRDSQEKFMECPACGSNVETSLKGESVASDSSIPPSTDQEEYEQEYEEDYEEGSEGPDRRIIFAICGAAAVVVVGLIILVTVILPSGSEPVGEPDVSPPQQAAGADPAPRPVASDAQPAGTFNLEPPEADTSPEESISAGQAFFLEAKIAFASDRDGNYEIYTMNTDGTELQRLTNNADDDLFPSWSPDATKIAVESRRGRNPDICIISADGSEKTNLTNDSSRHHVPSWSADGNKIAFVSDRDGNREIYVMNVAGGEQTRLTDDPAADRWPCWLPLSFSGSGPATVAGGGGARKIELKLRLQPGAKRRLRLCREFNSSYTVKGQQRDSSGTLTTELEFEVEQVDANGVMSLKVTHLRFHETETEGGQKEYDSSKPDTLGDSLFGPIFSALIGRSFVAKVTPEGKIVELEGLAQMYQQMAEPLVDYQDEATRRKYDAETAKRRLDTANQEFRSREERIEATRDKLDKGHYTCEENIRDMLAEVIMSFPEGPVGIGDSWTAAPSSLRALELGDYTYTLRGKEQAAVFVDISAKVDVDRERPARADGSSGPSRTTLAGSGQGSVEIDPGTGWMLRKNMTLRYSGETKTGPSKRDPSGRTVAQSMESITAVEPME